MKMSIPHIVGFNTLPHFVGILLCRNATILEIMKGPRKCEASQPAYELRFFLKILQFFLADRTAEA